MVPLHLSGENDVGCSAVVRKCCTFGVTEFMQSFHSATFLALSRALIDAASEGYLHNSITVFSIPTSINPK